MTWPRRALCWLGFHRFGAGWARYGATLTCLNCGGRFVMVRSGMTDMPRFDRAKEE